MNSKKNKSSYLISAVVGSLLLSGATSALAQVGSMDYEPFIGAPVPVGGGFFMLVLGSLLGVVAFWKISRSGLSGNKAVAVFLTMGAAAFTMTGGQVLHQAYAQINNDLSDPLGGTVDIFPGYQEYQNTSGAVLQITAINLDDCNVPAGAEADPQGAAQYPECSVDGSLISPGGICTTDYPPCIDNTRLTNRAGYYWVRADYRAPLSDHGAVCAEFGLVATPTNVTLTWDATLLETLSNDFGYQSNGDDADAATSMWCWDGDGGPFTPAGYCETHNFGSQYTNYGFYDIDPDVRPVFTCQEQAVR